MKQNLISNTVWRITTVDQLLEVSKLSKDEIEIIKGKVNKWEGQAKNDETKQIEVTELFQIVVDWKYRSDLLKPEIRDVLLGIFWQSIPTYMPNNHPSGSKLVNISLPDIHFGRINEKKPDKYLKDITDRVYDIINSAQADKALIVNLWDFYDTEMNHKTSSGKHIQHLSMSAIDMFKRWLQFHIELLHNLWWLLPTDMIFIPGNHDRSILANTKEAIKLYFTHNNNVNIVGDDHPRQYYKRWHNTLGFSHGDGEKEKDMLKVFSMEGKLNKYNYRDRGHRHEASRKQYWPLIVDTLSSPAVQTDREKNKFNTTPGKLIGKVYDIHKGKTLEIIR